MRIVDWLNTNKFIKLKTKITIHNLTHIVFRYNLSIVFIISLIMYFFTIISSEKQKFLNRLIIIINAT